jgi:pimeloyl-ACP methyl ester carboxylesterase
MKHGALASDMRVVAQAMYDDMVTDLRPRLKDIKQPVTMLYPQDDRLVSKDEADKLYADSYAAAPKVKLVRIPGSYHFIMQDQPALFEAQLKAFLR